MHPGYVFNRKTYKSVSGLLNAIAKDSKAVQVGMVSNNQIRTFAADGRTVLVTYDVTPPKVGETQVITRVAA